jgi:hypothetical protein
VNCLRRGGSAGIWDVPCRGSRPSSSMATPLVSMPLSRLHPCESGSSGLDPAPRSMDTMAFEIDDEGNITVQTGLISSGGSDNPERAVSHPLLPVSVARPRVVPESDGLIAAAPREGIDHG